MTLSLSFQLHSLSRSPSLSPSSSFPVDLSLCKPMTHFVGGEGVEEKEQGL